MPQSVQAGSARAERGLSDKSDLADFSWIITLDRLHDAERRVLVALEKDGHRYEMAYADTYPHAVAGRSVFFGATGMKTPAPAMRASMLIHGFDIERARPLV